MDNTESALKVSALKELHLKYCAFALCIIDPAFRVCNEGVSLRIVCGPHGCYQSHL